MAKQPIYVLRVIGVPGTRFRGVLGMVMPQALELVTRSAYIATVSEATTPTPGSLHVRSDGDGGVVATWHHNPNLPTASPLPPAWVDKAINMSRELGRNITWQPPT